MSPCEGCPHWGACHYYGAECKRPQAWPLGSSDGSTERETLQALWEVAA